MKLQKLLILFSLLLSWSVTAQVNFVNPTGNQRYNNEIDPNNLTDSQYNEAKNYVHSGKQQRVLNEGCINAALGEGNELSEGQMRKFQEALQNGDLNEEQQQLMARGNELCGGNAEAKVFGIDPMIMQMVSKMWTMIIGSGFGGGGFVMRDLRQEAQDKADAARVRADTARERADSLEATRETRTAELNQAREQYQIDDTLNMESDGVSVTNEQLAESRANLDSAQANVNEIDQASTDATQANADATQAQTDADNTENKQQEDYCKYIPMGVEMVAQFQQQTHQTHIEQNPTPEGAGQYSQVMKVARSYEGMAENSKVLAVGWGTTTTCYVAMMAMTPVALSGEGAWKNYLKVGAAGFMTYYYSEMVKIHRERQKAMEKIAKQLPGRGDCNPITDRDCYCMEPSTRDDPQYCAPFTHKRKFAAAKVSNTRRTACIDSKAKEDPNCSCIVSDSCLDKGFSMMFEGTRMGGELGTNFFGDLKGLSTGAVDVGNLSGLQRAQQNAARGMSFLKKRAPSNIPGDRPLKANEKKQVAALKKFGIPAKAARGLVLSKLSPSEQKAASKMASRMRRSFNAAKKYQPKAASGLSARYSGGSGMKRRKKKSKGSTNNPFAKFMKKKKGFVDQGNGRILSFAEEAQNAAQITNRPDVSIFQIISHRYRKSGIDRLK